MSKIKKLIDKFSIEEHQNEKKSNDSQYLNKVFYKNSQKMNEIPNNSVDLIITSPPYFNIKDYAKDGKQKEEHSTKKKKDIGSFQSYSKYIEQMTEVWVEAERILVPNGKLCINVPLMPMLKANYSTHYNRDIFDIHSDIQNSILKNTNLHLLDVYIWNRTNSTKKLMFGSYPYPSNFYNQNIIEFIIIFVKDGKPNIKSKEIKEASKLTKEEWINYTKQIWDIPIPNKKDIAFGNHSAIMPEEIPKRLIKLFSFKGDVVLDPFMGSGTTCKMAKKNGRKYIGIDMSEEYCALAKSIIDKY